LENEPGIPDGQTVSLKLISESPTGGGLRRSFGAWVDDGAELDDFLQQIRGDRKRQREEPAP
jgi:hypothetical protein